MIRSVYTRHHTNFLPFPHSLGVVNIGIQIQKTADCRAKARCNSHQRVPSLELVDRPDIKQLSVINSIEHPCVEPQSAINYVLK